LGEAGRALSVALALALGLILAYFFPESLVPYVIALLGILMYTKRTTDERDEEVGRRAASAAYTVSVNAFALALVAGKYGADLKLAAALAFLLSVFSYWIALAYYYRKMG